MNIKKTLAICLVPFCFLSVTTSSFAGVQGQGRLSACKLVTVRMPSYGYDGGLFGGTIGSHYARPDYEGQKHKVKVSYYCADKIHTPVTFAMWPPNGRSYLHYQKGIALKRGNHTITLKDNRFRAMRGTYKFKIFATAGGSSGMNGKVILTGKRNKCPIKKITSIKYYGGDAKGHGALSPCTMSYAKLYRNKAGKLPTRSDQRTRIIVKYKCSRKISESVMFTMRKPDGKYYTKRFDSLKKGKGKINVSLYSFRAKPGSYLFKFRTIGSKSYGISRVVRLDSRPEKCPDSITGYDFQ